MALVAAKCTECGANIEVDDSKDAGICRHCGTAFITEKAIHNHTTHVTKNITKNIFGKEKTDAEEYLANGETFIKLKDWEKAIRAFTQAAESAPQNYQTWFGLVRSETKGFTDIHDTLHIEHLRKAFAVASDEEKKTLTAEMDSFSTAQRKHFEEVYIERTELANQAFPDARRANKRGKLGCILGLTIVLLPLYYIFAVKGRSKIKKFIKYALESNKAERRLVELGAKVPDKIRIWDAAELKRVEEKWRSSVNLSKYISDFEDDVCINGFEQLGVDVWIGYKFLQ